MSYIIDSQLADQVAQAETKLKGSEGAAERGPSARLQPYLGKELTAEIIREVHEAEKELTKLDGGPTKGGPTSVLQQVLTTGSSTKDAASRSANSSGADSSSGHSGTLDSATLSKITAAEKKITGEDHAVKGGPTAKAQTHANEPITSEALHDITEGEKKITGGERVKGGPTSTAQSELGKSRN
jgi:hypothetical protein